MATSHDGSILLKMKELLATRSPLEGLNWMTMPDFDARLLSTPTARLWIETKEPANAGYGFENLYQYKLIMVVGITIPWEIAGNEDERTLYIYENEIRVAVIENRTLSVDGITVTDIVPGGVRFMAILGEEDGVMMSDGMEFNIEVSYTEVIT